MTKILLCNNEFDLRNQSVDDIENVLQDYFNDCTKKDLMKVKVWGDKHFLGTRIYRSYGGNYKDAFEFNNPDVIPCIDSDILLGRLGENQEIAVMPPGLPFGYLFTYEVKEFIKIYKANCKARSVKRPKTILVITTPSYIEIILAE